VRKKKENEGKKKEMTSRKTRCRRHGHPMPNYWMGCFSAQAARSCHSARDTRANSLDRLFSTVLVQHVMCHTTGRHGRVPWQGHSVPKLCKFKCLPHLSFFFSNKTNKIKQTIFTQDTRVYKKRFNYFNEGGTWRNRHSTSFALGISRKCFNLCPLTL